MQGEGRGIYNGQACCDAPVQRKEPVNCLHYKTNKVYWRSVTSDLPALAAANEGVRSGPVVRVNMERGSWVDRAPQEHGVPGSYLNREQLKQVLVGVDLHSTMQ